MTTLSSSAIRSRLQAASMDERLVVSPILEEEQLKSGQASIDVRLGSDFCFVAPSSMGLIDEFGPNGAGATFAELYRHEYIPLGGRIIIHPHQFMLGQTLEYLRLPIDLMSYVVGRSTWGRAGLIVATAVGIHPLFAGNLTLELRNLGETPLVLYPGQTIAQLFFHTVVGPDGAPATEKPVNAQYAGADMIPRRISSDATRKTILKIIANSKKS
jgi:dCTP deaminase